MRRALRRGVEWNAALDEGLERVRGSPVDVQRLERQIRPVWCSRASERALLKPHKVFEVVALVQKTIELGRVEEERRAESEGCDREGGEELKEALAREASESDVVKSLVLRGNNPAASCIQPSWEKMKLRVKGSVETLFM